MRYTLLGPVEVTATNGPVTLERPQRRAFLALLLLHANQFLGTDQIIQALWGGAPPATARAQLHALVAAIRRTLQEHSIPDELVTRPGGYTLRIEEDACDVQRFESLLLKAEACTTPAETVRMLRVALDLWRGAPLEGITAAYAEAARARLQEQRLGATERLTDLELAAGRHAELIAPLMAQVAAHPLRERLVGRLMLALYRNGRQSDALQAARDLRRRLADEEGLDPGADLVRLETAILRADPALDPPAIPPTSDTGEASRVPHAQQAPQLLPPRPATSTDRVAEAAALDAAVTAGSAVIVLHGPASAGKTAFAVEWSREAAGRFPDGRLVIDLRGSDTATALTPAEAVDEALHALGVPPEQLGLPDRQAQAKYRSLVAGRRMLILLDDAGADGPVRALLSEGSHLTVLVTARLPVAGAHAIAIDARPPVEPPDWDGLSPDATRLLYLFAQVHVREVTAGTAAAMIECPAGEAERLLGDLVARRLVDPGPDGTYRLPAVLHRRAAALPLAVDDAVVDRVGAFYVHAVLAAAELLYPNTSRPYSAAVPRPATPVSFAGRREALDWLEAERYNAIGLLLQASEAGNHQLTCLLADSLRGYFALTMRIAAWARTAEAALAAARAAGDDEAESAAHLSLAELHLRRGRRPGAPQAVWSAPAERPAMPAAVPPVGALPRSTRTVASARRKVLLVGVALTVVAGTAAASGRLGQPTDAMAVVEEATRGPATVVLRSTVPGLRIDEAVDFDDGGHLTDDRAPGIDITPYASGNHLSGKNGALMALLPAGAPANYQSCADIAVTDRVQTLLGTYGLPDGQRICLWTKPGRAVLMTLTRAPRQQQPEVIFDYVVWQGAAPVSPRPVAPMPADTNEDSYSLGSLTDEIGVNIDPGGGKVDPNSDMVDMSFNGKATKLKVERGALLALIPDGAPTAYATCTGVDPDKINVGLDLQGRPAGFRFCLFAYSGRVALVSVSRTATPDLHRWISTSSSGGGRSAPTQPPTNRRPGTAAPTQRTNGLGSPAAKTLEG